MATVGRFFRDPVVSFFLFGPRGTGKSTWLRERHSSALWLDLLRPEVYRRYAARPERLRELLAANPDAKVVVIDEVQKAPGLLEVVHEQIESNRGVRFVLTGSSARKLRREGVNLLAGRAVLRYLHPFLAGELADLFDLPRALKQGLLPIVWDAERPDDVLRAYVALYLREEVQQEAMVRDLGAFARFLEVSTFSHGAVLNLSELAREAEISRKTVEGYLGVLEDLLLTFQVPVFTRRARRQLSSHPKLYWFDAGVFRAMRPAGPLDRAEEIEGAALEGLVAQHLRAWVDDTGGASSLSFWRTRAGSEVDFVVYGPSGFWALEVKSSASVRPRDLVGLRAFREDYPEAEVRLLYRGEEHLSIDGIACVPVADYLLGVVPGRALP